MTVIETPSSPTDNKEVAANDWRKREIRLAIGNAVKLGSSLIATWGIALVARLYIPRFLGPDRFGMLNFAEAFTATAFVMMSFGVDTYVRKEISVRPEHANDFVGGFISLRLLLLVVVYAGMEVALRATHCNAQVRQLVYIYGATQFFMVGNATSAGLLQAVGQVNEMSVLSVATKLAWGGFTFVAIAMNLGLWAFALTLTLTEGGKSLILFRLARKHLKFKLRVYPRATGAVIWAALPFFVSSLATTVYDKIGVNLLSFLTNTREVGWFGAASGLSGMTLLLTPLVSWILIPLFARSAAEAHDELFAMVRRSLEIILSLAIPVSLMMLLGADLWIRVLFGRAFTPAAASLRILAVGTVLMYVSIVAAYALAVLSYTWRMSLVFVGGMIVSPTCNFLFIRWMSNADSPGAGGSACALATLVTEVAIVTSLLTLLGKRCFDRRLVSATFKSLAIAAAIVGLDSWLFKSLGLFRLVIDAALYAAAVMMTGAIRIREMIAMFRTWRRSKRT